MKASRPKRSQFCEGEEETGVYKGLDGDAKP